jgi:cyclopropane-fatty-acyl-phospholipid synthase
MTNLLEPILDQGLPESFIRFGIRRLLRQRLKQEDAGSDALRKARMRDFIAGMDASPIALDPHLANQQHYDVPPRFFELVLGPRMKYSSCWWDAQTGNLAEAEAAMLQITAEHAGIQNNQEILELGCGWGSLTLFLAKTFPLSRITGISNSAIQREFIISRAKALGLNNVGILTADMNDVRLAEKFDRIVSVEMFEHMRNYRMLLHRIAGFLKPDGRLFVHMFVHREFAYPFVPEDATDWMAQHFFSGGMMPSANLLLHFTDDLLMQKRWNVSGTHYQKTAEAWLKNHENHREEIEALFETTYGAGEGSKWWQRWRIFFLSCSELWGYRNGEEWFVGHYLMSRR